MALSKPMNADPHSVFLNVPFDKSYEPVFLALIAGLVSSSCTPRSVVEIPDSGQGRLKRLRELIAQCGASIHDLSRVGTPVRFNMPFELGLACALSETPPSRHRYFILEAKSYRLQKTLSDINGHDPFIHGGRPGRAIQNILDAFHVKGRPVDQKRAKLVHDALKISVTEYFKRERRNSLFNLSAFKFCVKSATDAAKKEGLIDP